MSSTSPRAANSWFADVTADGELHDRVWRAYFDGNTPPHLITAFTRALADGAPLARDPLHVPALGRRHQRSTTREVPAAAVAFALENRVKELAARGTPTPPPPRNPRVPPPRRSR
ncbi:DUF317 domain-containing protein [Streptomyces sp. NPDC002536]